MTYSLSPRLFVEDGPAVHAAHVAAGRNLARSRFRRQLGSVNDHEAVQHALKRAAGSWGGYQAWRQLDPDDRLDIVERALGSPANDDLPLAL